MTATADQLNAAMEAAAGTGLPYLDMRVIFDDGRELAAHADQRDMRRAQVAIGVDPDRDPIGFSRACAWAYLTRTDQLAMGWADFDGQVPFCIPFDKQTTADPTRPATAG
jgi:hypothetical protein